MQDTAIDPFERLGQNRIFGQYPFRFRLAKDRARRAFFQGVRTRKQQGHAADEQDSNDQKIIPFHTHSMEKNGKNYASYLPALEGIGGRLYNG